MLILPAIDILGGSCVRLFKGEYDTAHKVAADPFETAASFERAGAQMLHIVDLDGAREGRAVNFQLIADMVASLDIPVEVGGGIRDMKTIEQYLSAKIARVILGTSALQNRTFVEEAVKEFGERIAVGIDAREGMICVEGWTRSSEISYLDFAKKMEDIGVGNIIFTDIERDGTLTSPNFEQLERLMSAVKVKITASGGIKNIDHIKRLLSMGVYAAICGKSLYEETLDLDEALRVSRG
ncbi:MAG: 1-(5-phosphoribosyl)-5-[(5-phosphoribosylamino)methylideneamino]imidazole-4-carboxamide isomerase [Clostridiales bacterium]|nr:1-(5-phosphoribosyl)-5-[(5-phosphoribosylamino)methylideneamino]imidazole-4-carboxamide isomerase [Clostridiales bacterium]